MDRYLPISIKAKQGRRQGLHHLVGEDGKTIILCRKHRGKEAIATKLNAFLSGIATGYHSMLDKPHVALDALEVGGFKFWL